MAGFRNIIKRIISGGGGGGNGGLTLRDAFRRIEGFVARISVTEEPTKRGDVPRPKVVATDSGIRTDQYRLPSISAAIVDSGFHRDGVSRADIRTSDVDERRADSARVAIVYDAPGTYTYIVPPGIVGGVMRMEAIGAGGGGGAAAVNGGGGGKGGGYARRNAQSVLAGQQLIITVPPASSAGTAGQAAVIAIAGGATIYSVPAYTFTFNASPSGATVASRPVCSTLRLSGAPVFSAVTLGDTDGSFSNIDYPPTAAGDILFLSLQTSSGAFEVDPAFTMLYSVNLTGSIEYRLYAKVAVGGESGRAARVGSNMNSSGLQIIKYVGASDYVYIGSNLAAEGSTTAVSTSFTGNQTDVAVYLVNAAVQVGSSCTTVSPPAGVTERDEYFPPGTANAANKKSVNDAPMVATVTTGTTYVSAPGGNAGGNGSATAGGAGATAQNGTAVGDVSFTGGNGTNGSLTAGGVGGAGSAPAGNTTGNTAQVQFGLTPTGQGATGATAVAAAGAASPYGGAGGGATTAGAASGGARGAVRLTFSI